jgi:ribosome-binding protein aMBF1 (putative translation factor)
MGSTEKKEYNGECQICGEQVNALFRVECEDGGHILVCAGCHEADN